MVDAAAFTIAMRDANIDKEFSGRLFEFLDEGAHASTQPPPAWLQPFVARDKVLGAGEPDVSVERDVLTG